MRAAYWDPAREVICETDVSADAGRPLIDAVLGHRSGRGHPALEVTRPDGSGLVVGTDGQLAIVMWTDSFGESFRSVGDDHDSRVLIYDYFGSWSEAPGSALVDLDDAITCLERFLTTGAPDGHRVLFTPE
jgi:hypothetical protein